MPVTEFKKSDPWDYQAPIDRAQILDLEPRQFTTISGQGDPNGADFAAALAALYGLSYAVRMCYRNSDPPAGAGAYTVGVLQGRWDLVDHSQAYDLNQKGNLAWTLMIRQPDFVTPQLFEQFLQTAQAKAEKKKEPSAAWFELLKFERSHGGLFAQGLHVGPYDTEPETFSWLEKSLTEQGFVRSSKIHYELYLGDPRKTSADKLRTILRVPVRKAGA